MFLTGTVLWISSAWATIYPLVPGMLAIMGWTYGTHLTAFGGSWWAARQYSISCVGEGMSGLFGSYWRLSSATCTTLLFSHAALLATAVASLVCTIAIFAWVWYKSFRYMLAPVMTNIRAEFNAGGVSTNHQPEVIDLTSTEPKVKIEPTSSQTTMNRYLTRSRTRVLAETS